MPTHQILATEEMVGAGHGTKADTLNRVINLITAQGDILYGTAAATAAALAKGAANRKLFMNAGATAPEWASGIVGTTHSRDLTTAAGDQTLTGAGFTPSACIVFYGIDTVLMGLGFCHGAVKHTIAYWSAYSNQPGGSVGTLIAAYSAAGVAQSVYTLAFNSDGAVFTWSKSGAPTGTLYFSVFWLR